MFDARMHTTLAQRLISIVSPVFDQTCFNRLATHFNISMFGHQTFIIVQALKFLIECLMVFKFHQARPNTIKQRQTRWPNGKTFGHQTVFDGVWSPYISRLFTAKEG